MSLASDTTSTRSKRSTLGVVQVGPVNINGIVFLKIRRCALCLLTNTDENVITAGPWRRELYPYQVWQRGPPENPSGQNDRVCTLVYVEGGVINEYADVGAFIEARKETE